MALVLIVEDEAFIRESARWMVEDLGHGTLVAANLDEALLHLSEARLPDALFVDIRLGGATKGGFVVADEAVRLRPGLKVLYTSGSALTADMSRQFAPGGRFLQKPYSPEQLEAALADIAEPAPSEGHSLS
jgi:CheY-like chemotaxis protein